jgi:pyruvate dehydrogenase phosphatase
MLVSLTVRSSKDARLSVLMFVGHGGEETAQLAAEFLPMALKDAFRAVVKKGRDPEKSIISATLQQTISDFDDYIKTQFLELFPGGVRQVSKMSGSEIREYINDHNKGGVRYAKAIRCMRGTTAVIAILSPKRKHLWVANIGDSMAGENLQRKSFRSNN